MVSDLESVRLWLTQVKVTRVLADAPGGAWWWVRSTCRVLCARIAGPRTDGAMTGKLRGSGARKSRASRHSGGAPGGPACRDWPGDGLCGPGRLPPPAAWGVLTELNGRLRSAGPVRQHLPHRRHTQVPRRHRHIPQLGNSGCRHARQFLDLY